MQGSLGQFRVTAPGVTLIERLVRPIGCERWPWPDAGKTDLIEVGQSPRPCQSGHSLLPCCSARLPWHNPSLVPPLPPQGKGVRVTGKEGKSEPRGKARHHAIKCSAKGAWQEATLV
jgi:hypothetical protein